MQVVIAGASGNVGRSLIPGLLSHGWKVTLVSRTPDELAKTFPQCRTFDYCQLEQAASGASVFLYLSAQNNSGYADIAAYRQVNVDLALSTRAAASRAGVKHFVYVSTIHALDRLSQSQYAQSKREGEEALLQYYGAAVQVVYLPAFVGERMTGKLAILSTFPHSLGQTALNILSAFRPIVHIERICAYMIGTDWTADALPLRVILSDGQQDNIVFRCTKRAFDFLAAFVFILLFFWLFGLIALAVRLDSPGPALFRQRRVGQNGIDFTCFKFRSMYVSTPQVGTHEVSRSSVTRRGSFLRQTKLDELPQLVNVLLNQMSLIGPRPCLPGQTAIVEARRAMGVLSLKPGITGLAQINKIDMSEPDTLARWDGRYLRLQSLLMDLSILIQTLRGKGGGDPVMEKWS